jgi:predicted ArsR family transcriptional regulator
MSKISKLSPVDLLVEKIALFFRLLGLGGQTSGEQAVINPRPVRRKVSKSSGDLGAKILRYLGQAREAVRKTDILQHIGKQASLDDVNQVLMSLLAEGKVSSIVRRDRPGRPPELWSLVMPVKVAKVKVAKSVKSVKVAKFVKPAKVKAVKVERGPKVVRMTVPELADKIWGFMRGHRKAVNRQDISGHLGHKVPAKKINECLAHLKRKGRARDQLAKNGWGRPAMLWSAAGKQ